MEMPTMRVLAHGSRLLTEWDFYHSAARRAIDEEIFSELRSLAEGDAEFLRDLVDTYVEQGEMLLADARSAAAAGQAPALVQIAHTLSGSSRNVGALELARLCSAIERDAQSDAVPPSALPAMVSLLAEPLEEACIALREQLRLTALEG